MSGPEIDFDTLYRRYGADVYWFAVFLAGRPEQAEDIAAETFVRAWLSPEPIRVGTVKAYLFTIARNLHRMDLRRARKHEAVDLEIRDNAPGPEPSATARLTLERLIARLLCHPSPPSSRSRRTAMHVQRCRRNGISSRPVAVTGLVLAVIVFGAILPALAQPSRARTGEVIAIRELQLKAGADAAQFEQFVRSTYNPAWEGAVPGMKGYIAKADRGAQKDSYALILVFDGEKTRDIVFPKEGGGASAAFAALVQPLLALNKDLDKFVEPGSLSVYTDYVVLR